MKNLISTVLLIASLCASIVYAGPDVQIGGVVIRGTQSNGLESFLGIRYAKPPVGEARWQAPEPLLVPAKNMLADAYGPACLQPESPYHSITSTSEDCLFLNIWRPEGAQHLPVVFWIHGGGFRTGSGQINGEHFASSGVIVVSINYRLGPLGFFAHPSLGNGAANYGLLDMIAALQWVNTNIEAFGGDPERVTLMGLSAGAMAVNMLATSDDAAGLFSRAIAHSSYTTWPLLRSVGAPLPGYDGGGLRPDKSAEQAAVDVASRAGATEQSPTSLRALDAVALINALDGFQLPIVDGISLREEPWALLADPSRKRVPMIIGGNSFEGAVMPATGVSENTFRQYIGTYDSALRSAYASDFEVSDQQGYARAFGDYRYLLSAWESMSAYSDNGDLGWMYYIDIPEPPVGLPQGTAHGRDMMLLWGMEGLTPQQQAVSDEMHQRWALFIGGLDPQLPDSAHWPQWNNESPRWLRFGADVTTEAPTMTERMNILRAIHQQRVKRRS